MCSKWRLQLALAGLAHRIRQRRLKEIMMPPSPFESGFNTQDWPVILLFSSSDIGRRSCRWSGRIRRQWPTFRYRSRRSSGVTSWRDRITRDTEPSIAPGPVNLYFQMKAIALESVPSHRPMIAITDMGEGVRHESGTNGGFLFLSLVAERI